MDIRIARGRGAAIVLAAGLAIGPAAWGQSPLEEPFPAVFELDALDGQTGFSIPGTFRDARVGFAMAAAGDVNADGIDDAIFGAPWINTAYVVFGNADGFAIWFDLGRLDGTNGFTLHGVASGDRCGTAVASAGDINGDGVVDIVVGAPDVNGEGSNAGEGYVVFGRRGAFPPSISLSDLDGSDGFVLKSPQSGYQTGKAVAPAGDFNHDGVDDVVITAVSGSPAGREAAGITYVVFGRAGGGFPASLDLSTLDGANGFALGGAQEHELSGLSVASMTDLNGDGLRDMVIGAPYHTAFSRWNGRAYVVFGRPRGSDWPAMFDLATIDGANGFVLGGPRAYSYAGWAVASAGDIDGDGMDDVVIGSPESDPFGYEPREGAAYVVFGRAGGGFPASMSLAGLDGDNGFAMRWFAGGRTGSAVGSAGDLNGDGVGDLVVGSSTGNVAHVVFGRSDSRFPRSFPLPGDDGFEIRRSSGDRTGAGLAHLGDINQDGVADLGVGSPWADADGRARAGILSVVFGRDLASCRADLDGDGELTIFDFLAFGNLFDLMDPAADFDGDGGLTIFDFLAFQNAFDLGCP
jgi:glycosylphosphatidylinositol phospholipase D